MLQFHLMCLTRNEKEWHNDGSFTLPIQVLFYSTLNAAVCLMADYHCTAEELRTVLSKTVISISVEK